jgi:hypothetical protein
MTTTCEGCGAPFEAQRSTARFCSDRCRKRTARRGGYFPAPDPVERPQLLAAIREDLVSAGLLQTVDGQVALVLAAAIESPRTTGAGVAALSRELRTVMRRVGAGSPRPWTPLDELQRRRDARLSGGGDSA